VLPTVAVILWAYCMYALFSIIRQSKGTYIRGRSRGRKFTWVALVASVLAGLGLIVWCCFFPNLNKTDQRLKLAGFLGTVYAGGWPGRVDRLNYPPVKRQIKGLGEQPVYTLLHPETPASQLGPEKKLPKPRPSRAAKKGPQAPGRNKVGKVAKIAKAPGSLAKKDKTAAKSRAKKKKRPAAARNR
jgi:hypothetical protein